MASDRVVDHEKRPIEDHQQCGMQDCRRSTNSSSNLLGLLANRSKKITRNNATVEDTVVFQDNQPVIQSGKDNNLVDCQKNTEDPAPSAKDTCVNTLVRRKSKNLVGGSNAHGVHDHGGKLVKRFKERSNIVDRRRETTVISTGKKWTLELHVDIACGNDIINCLPISAECFKWDKPVLFGRRQGADIFINDESASRDHVELMGQIFTNGEALFMTRNASISQGYNLNGQNNTNNNQWIPLNKGDQIEIAGLVFVVDIIPAKAILDNFAIQFKLPQVHDSPVVTNPGAMYPTVPHSPNGHQGLYNQHTSIQPHANPHSNFAIPQPVHGNCIHFNLPPNTGTSMQAHWSPAYGSIPPSQPHLTGDWRNITNDMVERSLQPYQGMERYVKLIKLRYLALEVVDVWEQLGRALGLEDWQLAVINQDYGRCVEKSYQMLKSWVLCDPKRATVENLKTALEDSTVGRGDLAVKYFD